MFFHSMNFSIGKDNEVLRDTVYKFAQNEIAPIANQIDKENSFPNHPVSYTHLTLPTIYSV